MSYYFGLLSVMGWVWAAVSLAGLAGYVAWRSRREKRRGTDVGE